MDLSEVIDALSQNGKSKGVKYLSGDMFDPSTFPKPLDVIYMKHILHDWSDEDCIEILKSCYEASGDNVTIILNEIVVPSAKEIIENGEDIHNATFTVDMVMLLIKGKEKTREQWKALTDASGFVITEIKTPAPGQRPSFITLKKK